MLNVLSAEWRKLRRPTLLAGTFAAALFFNALVSIFLFVMVDSPEGNGDRGRVISRAMLETSQGSVTAFSSLGSLFGIIILCVFAAQTAQEYSLGTLRNLLVRQPRRWIVLAGKFAAMKIFALILVMINAVISIAISVYFAGQENVSTSMWFTSDGRSAILHTLVNTYIAVVFYGVTGMALGIFFRSPITSISVSVVWFLIIENLIIAVKPVTSDWMPGTQFQMIAMGGSETNSYLHAMAVSLVFVLALTIASFTTFSQRDVAN